MSYQVKIQENVTAYDTVSLEAYMNAALREATTAGHSGNKRRNEILLQVMNFASGSYEAPVKLKEVWAHHETRLSLGTPNAVRCKDSAMEMLSDALLETEKKLPDNFYIRLIERTGTLAGIYMGGGYGYGGPKPLSEKIYAALKDQGYSITFADRTPVSQKKAREVKKRADIEARITRAARWPLTYSVNRLTGTIEGVWEEVQTMQNLIHSAEELGIPVPAALTDQWSRVLSTVVAAESMLAHMKGVVQGEYHRTNGSD